MKAKRILRPIIVVAITAMCSFGLHAQSFTDETITDNTTQTDASAVNSDVISINGASNNIFSANWSPGAGWVPGMSAAYNDQHPIAYIWQLSNSENFDTVLISQEVANTFHFATTSAFMDGILQNAGISINDTVQLYHRVIASDGNWSNTGQALSIKVVRTGGNTYQINPVNSATLAPVPAHDYSYLSIDASEPFNGSVMVTDMNGKILMSSPLQVTATGITRVKLDVDQFQRGIYFVTVIQDDRNAALLKLIKQ